jgi:eukaryotic-like serine/threonine-protein kinase
MSAPVQIGDVLAGKYRIERILGAGGMGVVVAATHLRLEQLVAIKFLLPAALESEDVVARFAREARSASRIQSEHVARVIDVGELEDGLPYMVMEYLEGSDLSGILADNGPLSIETTVDYLLQACEALAEAHAAGIVHRDLKPANLFLAARADGTSIVKVLDFGISKAASDAATTAARLTGTAVIMGSPLYMSPEQLRSSRDVDARTDVWSLGVIFFELVTGEPPFMGESVTEIIANIMTEEAPPLDSVLSEVPTGLQAVLSRALARKRDQRFASVVEFSQELARFGSDGARLSAEVVRRVLRASPASVIGEPPGTLVSRTRDTNEPVAVQARTAVRVEDQDGASIAPPHRAGSAGSDGARSEGGAGAGRSVKAHPLGDTLLAGPSPAEGNGQSGGGDPGPEVAELGPRSKPGDPAAPSRALAGTAKPTNRTTALAIGLVAVAALGAAGFSLTRGEKAPGSVLPDPSSGAAVASERPASSASSSSSSLALAPEGASASAAVSASATPTLSPASASALSPTIEPAAATVAGQGRGPTPPSTRTAPAKTAAVPTTSPPPPATTVAPPPPPTDPAKGSPLDKLNKVQ